MTDSMFQAPGRFFRGNLHTHSNRSDGALEAEEVCRRYKTEGYDFLALTDHFVGTYGYPITDTRPYRDNQFTTILGAELHSGAMANGELWHILAVGLPLDFEVPNAPHFKPVEDQESGAEIARRAREAGAYVAIAHPQWSALTMEDARTIDAAHAVEVYNHGCGVGADRADGFHTLELLLSEGRRLDLCATDDAHFTEPDHFGGWVMVKAQENRPESLLEALKAGHYYSSQGPDFVGISWSDKTVDVESSAVSSVIVQGQGSAAVAVHGDAMTRTQVSLIRFTDSPWLRVTIVDRDGKRAWCNPVWR
ncbi:CehA/McbA family metallohydrolase [Nitratireductor sp. XY-223]|uniref:PHP domain-containing protein n=1 Tax=Nitratireductor sp. XY-223 TaxID=2561926 RepID=UPI0010A9C7E0|nr:CehA/McbA family metallohydrolase [Nitratireductor sp. XY-223]